MCVWLYFMCICMSVYLCACISMYVYIIPCTNEISLYVHDYIYICMLALVCMCTVYLYNCRSVLYDDGSIINHVIK